MATKLLFLTQELTTALIGYTVTQLLLDSFHRSKSMKPCAFIWILKPPILGDIQFYWSSLGGGLASLMAVFFDTPATVFDEAPFQLTALNSIILSALELSLLAGGYTDLDFATYNLSLGVLFPFRESNVNHIYLEGEILAPIRFAFPTISASDTNISMGDSNLSALNRHSMALMTAMQVNEDFATLIRELPNFGTYLTDSNWFGNDSRSSAPDLLKMLLNEQYNQGINNGKLAQFIAEINALRGNDGVAQNNVLIQDALMATVMNYYSNKALSAANNLFTLIGNSLNFKYSDIGTEKHCSFPSFRLGNVVLQALACFIWLEARASN